MLLSPTMIFPVSSKENRPQTQQVDYFSFEFDLIDLHACWRKATHSVRKPAGKSWHITVQGKRRENAAWRRFFQARGKLPRYSLKALDWQKAKETRGAFYGPFYSSDEVLGATATSDTETSSLYTLHSRAPSSPSESSFSPSSASHINISANANIKPALKRNFHSKLHVGKIKRDRAHRRTCSESLLFEERKKGNHTREIHSPDTPSPKEIVLQFFGGAVGYHSPASSKEMRHITFNSNDEEWVFESSKPHSQDLCIAASVDERFRSLQALINEEFERKKQLEAENIHIKASGQETTDSDPPYLADEDDDDDTNTATPFDLVSMAFHPPIDSHECLTASPLNEIDSDTNVLSSLEEIMIPLRREKRTEFGERNCAFIEHMLMDKEYLNDSEFLDYPDDEISDLSLEERVQISPAVVNQAKRVEPGLVRLGIELTLAVISAAWW